MCLILLFSTRFYPIPKKDNYLRINRICIIIYELIIPFFLHNITHRDGDVTLVGVGLAPDVFTDGDLHRVGGPVIWS